MPPDLGLAPIVAVHDPDFVDFMRRAYPAWVAEGHITEPGQPHVVGYLFANAGFAARHRKDRRPATIRAELGLYAMDTMSLIERGHVRRRPRCGPRRGSRRRSGRGERAGGVCRRPATGPSCRPGVLRWLVLLQQRRRRGAAVAGGGLARVAIVDIDAHQGNGTQEIFWDRDDVLYASVHVDPADGWFPHIVGYADERGGGAGEGWTHNEPIPAGSGDEPWLAALERLLQTVESHGSDALVVSLGVDAAVDDPAAPLMVTSEGFRTAGERLAGLRLPTVFVQEGGYDLTRLVPLVLDVLEGFESVSAGRS